MQKQPPDSESSLGSHAVLGVGKAVLIGHLIVTVPVLIIILGISFLGRILAPSYSFLFLFVGFILAWAWWSLMVPRWRRWALKNGAPADRLQKWAAATGLVWPKGWIFEKTEFKAKDEKKAD
jgi:hypothetical protein